MAFLDFIKSRNAAPQQSVAQTQPAPTQAPAPSVDSLPANVKAQAVEAARPAAEMMKHDTAPPPAPQANPQPARGRSPGIER